MASKEFLKASGKGCVIAIDAVPGAPRSEIGDVNPWRGALQIRIAAEAKEGEANSQLVQFLAERLHIPRDSIRVLKGERSHHKLVFVDLSKEKVERLLGR